MNTQAQKRQRSRPSKPLAPQELALRIPTAEERREVADLLKLSDEQSDLLWRRVDSMCRQFVNYRQATALPGTERRALLAEARRWSRRLAAFEESVAEASPHLTRKLGRFIGPVLAAALNEIDKQSRLTMAPSFHLVPSLVAPLRSLDGHIA